MACLITAAGGRGQQVPNFQKQPVIDLELQEQDYRRAREELSQLESKLRLHISPTVTLIPLN